MYYKITTTTIVYILSAMILSGCSPLVHTQSPQLIMPTNNDLGKPGITEIYIDISCEDVQIDNEIRMIQGISENDMIAVTIELGDQCRSHKIPSQVFDAITTKKLYMVHWYSTIADYGSGMTYYQLSDMEIHQIAKAPWKWLSIGYGPGGQYEPTLVQYKILRNEKTSVREGFEPNGVPFYTREEFDRCQQFAQKDRSKDADTFTNNINSCLKELPPLP